MKRLFRISSQYLFYVLLIIVFISFLLININIVYFGDDYYFLQYKNYNFIEHFRHLFSFYCTDNGRFIVHLLITCILKLPMIYWKIANSIMLTSICLFMSKITSTNKENKVLILLISFFLISSIEIEVTRQSMYWLTGSFNYVYPCFVLLIYAFLLTKIDNKKYYYVSLLFAFLSSASMEQSALMSFGLTFLILLSKFDKHKNIRQVINDNKKIIVLILITLVGALSVLLAPAQFNRIMLESEYISITNSIVENIKLILSFYTQSNTIFYFHLFFLFFALCFVSQHEKNRNIKLVMISINLLGIALLVDLCFFGFYIRLLKYVFLFLLGICFIYYAYKIYHKAINRLTITIILLCGSQLMMIISPVLGYRNFIFALIAYLHIIGIIASKIKLHLIYQIIICFSLCLISILLNCQTSFGYYQTNFIDKKNITIIKNSDTKTSDKNKMIALYKYRNDDYSWCAPYISDFHLIYYKKFYNLKCTIKWTTFY